MSHEEDMCHLLYDSRCKVSTSIGELLRATHIFFSLYEALEVLDECDTRR